MNKARSLITTGDEQEREREQEQQAQAVRNGLHASGREHIPGQREVH